MWKVYLDLSVPIAAIPLRFSKCDGHVSLFINTLSRCTQIGPRPAIFTREERKWLRNKKVDPPIDHPHTRPFTICLQFPLRPGHPTQPGFLSPFLPPQTTKGLGCVAAADGKPSAANPLISDTFAGRRIQYNIRQQGDYESICEKILA